MFRHKKETVPETPSVVRPADFNSKRPYVYASIADALIAQLLAIKKCAEVCHENPDSLVVLSSALQVTVESLRSAWNFVP